MQFDDFLRFNKDLFVERQKLLKSLNFFFKEEPDLSVKIIAPFGSGTSWFLEYMDAGRDAFILCLDLANLNEKVNQNENYEKKWWSDIVNKTTAKHCYINVDPRADFNQKINRLILAINQYTPVMVLEGYGRCDFHKFYPKVHQNEAIKTVIIAHTKKVGWGNPDKKGIRYYYGVPGSIAYTKIIEAPRITSEFSIKQFKLIAQKMGKTLAPNDIIENLVNLTHYQWDIPLANAFFFYTALDQNLTSLDKEVIRECCQKLLTLSLRQYELAQSSLTPEQIEARATDCIEQLLPLIGKNFRQSEPVLENNWDWLECNGHIEPVKKSVSLYSIEPSLSRLLSELQEVDEEENNGRRS